MCTVYTLYNFRYESLFSFVHACIYGLCVLYAHLHQHDLTKRSYFFHLRRYWTCCFSKPFKQQYIYCCLLFSTITIVNVCEKWKMLILPTLKIYVTIFSFVFYWKKKNKIRWMKFSIHTKMSRSMFDMHTKKKEKKKNAAKQTC